MRMLLNVRAASQAVAAMTHRESEATFGCWMQAKMAEHATAR